MNKIDIIYTRELYNNQPQDIGIEIGNVAPKIAPAVAYLPISNKFTYIGFLRLFFISSHALIQPARFTKNIGVITTNGFAILLYNAYMYNILILLVS
jgi:hypothetical protein